MCFVFYFLINPMCFVFFQFDLGDTVVFQLCVYLYAFFVRFIREFLILS
jgi:hypothetical protein